MVPSRVRAHDSGMKRLAILGAAFLGLALVGSAGALLTPGRTLTAPAPVTALSVTNRVVVYSVGRTRANCGSVVLWDTPRLGHWTFGSRTILGCEEGPSGGFGIPAVAVTGERVFWLTAIGGNVTDWQLWSATPTRRLARRLAFASSDTDGPPAIVLGQGTSDGVPYAVGQTVTFVSSAGARRFRTAVDAPVRLLTSGVGPGAARVVAVLDDGRVVLLSRTGVALRTDDYGPAHVRAVALGFVGPLVQVGSTVTIGSPTAGTRVTLPPGALMLDYRQGSIVYRRGTQVRARKVSTGKDTLLRVIPVKPWQTMPFSTDAGGSGWADGRRVSWRSGPLG
jgi:hypothetical protein